jgi:hypothetical protein
MAKRILAEIRNLRLKVSKNAIKSANINVVSTTLNSSVFFVEKTTRPAKKNRALNSIRIFDIAALIR